jgi:5-formyltetrahydrofolate cyclo-ligase
LSREREVESQILVRELRKILGEKPQTIALYFPYLDEPDLRPLITEFLEQKNVICLPKIEDGHLKMHPILSLEDVRRNPVTNVPEPIDRSPLDEASINVVIIPCRAFTARGERLGRGNGGYDHWIVLQRTRNPATKYIGVCFECQIVQELPLEMHDEKVDTVMTARKTFGIEN